MATRSHVTMLREITAAGDRERTGALDVEWDGGHASLFFLFGHPSHVVYETVGGQTLVGSAALESLVAELPSEFRVAPWRRAMVPEDTIRLSAEDLRALFEPSAPAEVEGVDADAPTVAAADETESAPSEGDAAGAAPDATTADNAVSAGEEGTPTTPATVQDDELPADAGAIAAMDEPAGETHAGGVPPSEPAAVLPDTDGEEAPPAAPSPDDPVAARLWFDLDGFPLLPLGPILFTDAMANVSNRETVLPRLPDCLLVVTAPDHKAAALVVGGVLVDAVWVTEHGGSVGDDATVALLESVDGQLTAYRMDDTRLATVLPVLWRGPRMADRVPAAWLRADAVAAEARRSQRTFALLVDAENAGVALFSEGALIAVYATAARSPVATTSALADLLHQRGARVAVAGDLHDALETADDIDEEADVEHEALAAIADEAGAVAPTTPGDVDTEVEETAAEADAPQPADVTGTALTATDAEATDAEATDAEATDAEVTDAEVTDGEAEMEAMGVAAVVAPRLDVDIDALRNELTAIAVEWLGADEAAPVAQAIAAVPPGVDEFVSAIAAIGQMEIPGHENAVVRAMAREMHYRATEVLCGV